MSALDLTAAVEAAARAAHDGCGCLDEPIQQWILDDARRDLTAALPFIEAAVREQIAAEIEAIGRTDAEAQRASDDADGIAVYGTTTPNERWFYEAANWAASIARGAR